MKRMKLSELTGNEILAQSLMTWDYQIILPEGAVLKKEYIAKIEEMGILEVYVKENTEDSNEIVILKNDIEKTVKSKVKAILERHTYQNNKELQGLTQAADEIITSILDEKEVVEKVFDIRERSADIYEHSISLCSLAILTALRLNVEKQEIHDIGVGCLLHDIGLRYTTLEYEGKSMEDMKQGALSEYKKHPVYGYTSVKDEEWISDEVKKIILYHHERLDGSGFPLRLKEAEIPFSCQIVSVCDAFDEIICGIAQRRTRVYEAVEYLKSFKNVKYNGKIVDAFLSFTAVYPAGSHVLTSDGEEAIVISQNKDFQDRPVIRIIKDKNGNECKDEKILDLVKVLNVYIEKGLE